MHSQAEWPLWKQASVLSWEENGEPLARYWAANRWQEKLSAYSFRPCDPTQWRSIGFVPCQPDSGFLVQANGSSLWVRIQEEQRVLPAAVVQQILQEQVRVREQQQNRKIPSSERRALKEELIQGLLPRAFTQKHSYWIHLQAETGTWVLLRAAAAIRERMCAFWREAFPDQRLLAYASSSVLSDLLGHWLASGEAHSGIELGDYVLLQHPAGAQLQGRRQDLTGPEWQHWLAQGYKVKKMGVVYDELLHVVVQDDWSFAQCKWPDITEDAEAMPGSDSASGEQIAESTAFIQTEKMHTFFSVLQAAVRDHVEATVEGVVLEAGRQVVYSAPEVRGVA